MTSKVAIIHTQFGPYHFARVKALKQNYLGNINLIQLASQEIQRQWINNHDVPMVTTIARGALETLNPAVLAKSLTKHLKDTQLDVVVIAGYFYPAMRAAAVWARQNGIATILLSDSQYVDVPRNPVKEWLKSQWIKRHFDGAFVAGASAAAYLTGLGFSPERIWRGYDVIDNEHFYQKAFLSHQSREILRRELQLPDRFFLYVGRFSPEKNLLSLLEAYYQYCLSTKQEAWSLVLVGDGLQKAALKDKMTQLGLSKIVFPGFKQIDQLPTYYALASALILPSISEPWGLVVNEAMACGLPILVSERCGCMPDLVFPGINGFVFDPVKVEHIAAAMVKMTQKSEEQRQKMGQASELIIANYTPQTWADALSDCIQTVCDRRHQIKTGVEY